MNGFFKKIISLVLLVNISIVPVCGEETPSINLTAKSAILMEASTGNILWESNPDEHLPIASVTKVMTMLLVMEAVDSGKIKLSDMVSTSPYAASMGGSQVFLEPNEQMSVSDMLKAVAVASGNDACVALAEYVSGSSETFVEQMNEKAKELQMENTHFANCNGLDAENHYSSAKDVAIMSRSLLKHENIKQYLGIWMDSLRDGKFGLANTNKLIRFYTGANGIKTGSTSNAKFCVSASAIRNNMQLIAVVLGSPTSNDRFSDATKLLDYGFANYSITNVVNKGDTLGSLPILKGVSDYVNIEAIDDFGTLVSKGKTGDIKKEIVPLNNISAPVSKGQKVGDLHIYVGGNEIGRIDIIASEDIQKFGFLHSISELFSSVLRRK